MTDYDVKFGNMLGMFPIMGPELWDWKLAKFVYVFEYVRSTKK